MKQRVTPRAVDSADGAVPLEGESHDDPMDVSAKGEFKLAFVSMGQGECTLIRCPDGTVGMIDCGSKAYFSGDVATGDKNRILKEIGDGIVNLIDAWSGEKIISQEPKVTNKNILDFLILTHCDGDHYNKLKDFINTEITISKVYFSDGPNSIGPDSFFGGDNASLFCIKNKNIPPNSMTKYRSSKDTGGKIMKGTWGTTEVIEVVINENERSAYSYAVGADSKVSNPTTDKGGSNSKYGTKRDLGEGVCEVISDSEANWEISIIAGNVLVADTSLASVTTVEYNGESDNDVVGEKRQFYAQADKPNPKKQKIHQANVWAPYSNPESKNTASLCTSITYNNKQDQRETILLMGDATNQTFDFLNRVTDASINCVLSNVPHHGSAVHCNDMNSAEELPVGYPVNYIQSKLRPQAAIVSCRPFYSSYKFPALNVVNHYTDTVSSLDDGHLFDQWIAVPPNGGDNIVQEQWDLQNKSDYTTVKKTRKKTDWHYLKEVNPPENSYRILCPDQGVMLQRVRINANIKLPDVNYDRVNDGFKYIYHEFQVF